MLTVRVETCYTTASIYMCELHFGLRVAKVLNSAALELHGKHKMML